MISRYLVLGLILAAIVVWLMFLALCKTKWLYTLAPLLWLGSAGAFWVYRLFFYLPSANTSGMMNDWSVGIYAQAGITLIAMGVIGIVEKKRC
jgi:hypothetical protein